MPYGFHYSENSLTEALEEGSISESSIDQSVLNILTPMYEIGLFDHAPEGDPDANVTSDEHNALAREIIGKSTVLLKNNENLLPIKLSNENGSIKQIAVIGDESIVTGTGSGQVVPPYVVTPTQGITAAVADAGFSETVRVVYSDGSDLDDVTSLAEASDIVVVLVATTSGEGNDRETLSLGAEQDKLVWTASAANPSSTVVAVTTPGASLMPWASDVNSIVVSWLPGQEAGNGLADVLFGIVNPSARLHVTIPNEDNELDFTRAQYPGKGFPPEADYSEGLLVGYRYYEANEITPVFPFGHGLSYSTYEYSGITFSPESDAEADVAGTVSFTLTNTGSIFGHEIAQLYLTFPSVAAEPPNQLKAFRKIGLESGASESVSFSIKKKDLSIWNADSHSWEMVSGSFLLKCGGSSRDASAISVSFSV